MKAQQLLVASAAMVAAQDAEPTPTPEAFDWDSLKASKSLDYSDCYDGFKCAKLTVPLDLKNETDDRTISIAIMTLPAVVDEDDETFGGTIFVNPGGPGGAGTSFMPTLGRHMQVTFDLTDKKHYEILSWDPRGIGYSEPKADCYPGNEPARNMAMYEVRAAGGSGRDNRTIPQSQALADAFALQCQAADKDVDIMSYTTTPAVVGDMLEILDRIDEGRQSSRKRRGLKCRDTKEKARMQFVGFSYGAALGQYLLTMYPERVSRMVLDGVASADEYANKEWINNVVDVDEMFDNFISLCNGAGSELCPLASSGESDAELKARVLKNFEALKERPVAALHPYNGAATAINDFDLRQLFGLVAYDPVSNFPSLSAIYANTFAGDYTTLMAALTQYDQTPAALNDCPGEQTLVDNPPVEGSLTFTCLDGADDRDKDLAYWAKHLEELKDISYMYGDAWQVQRSSCGPWKFKGHWTFNGPFTSPKPNNSSETASAPLLLLNSRLDPVTPLSFAREVQKDFPGSKVLVQDSIGHCAIVTAPSKCRDKRLQAYMAYGEVPEEDEAECEADCEAFELTCRAVPEENVPEGADTGGAVSKRESQVKAMTERPLKLRKHRLSVF